MPNYIFKMTLESVGLLWNLLSLKGLPEKRGKKPRDYLHAVLTRYSNSNISCLNHAYIVCTIPWSGKTGGNINSVIKGASIRRRKQSQLIISNILYYRASWSGELTHGIKHDIKALILISLFPRRPGSTRAKSSIGTSWVVTQQSQHHLHHHHFVFLHGQIHMLRNMFCSTLFHWILWMYDKLDCRWQCNKPVSRILLLISTHRNMLNVFFLGKEQPCLLLAMWRL